MAQLVKNLSAMWETWVQSLGWEDPLEKWPGECHGLYSLQGHKELDMIEQLSHISKICLSMTLKIETINIKGKISILKFS